MSQNLISIDEAYVSEIARSHLSEIQRLIHIAKRQGQQSEDLLLADHLVAMSLLAFENIADRTRHAEAS